MKTKLIGKIKITESVEITDPCYNPGIWCAASRTLLPGTYNCYAVSGKYNTWGYRVKSIYIVHESYKSRLNWKHECFFTVDSGQAGIFCTNYYSENWDKESWYKKVCKITNDLPKAGTVDDFGFVSRSGVGDGCYNCYSVKDGEERIIALKLLYL